MPAKSTAQPLYKNAAGHPHEALHALLENRYERYNQPAFIEADPVSVPHLFTKKQDIEISGFFAAILAWGQRKTIIKKSLELMQLLDNSPADFVLHHSEQDLKALQHFKHRTFNSTDLLFFIAYFKEFYSRHTTLELAFTGSSTAAHPTQAQRLSAFHDQLFSVEYAPARTRKHVSTPARNAACKRINMYLRWMVRKDNRGVDFGIWNQLKHADLICPCDVHVDRVARKLGLITRPKPDWQTALELTHNLAAYDIADPVKYDFALFGLGIEEKY